jgi:hypothetical protein
MKLGLDTAAGHVDFVAAVKDALDARFGTT